MVDGVGVMATGGFCPIFAGTGDDGINRNPPVLGPGNTGVLYAAAADIGCGGVGGVRAPLGCVGNPIGLRGPTPVCIT